MRSSFLPRCSRIHAWDAQGKPCADRRSLRRFHNRPVNKGQRRPRSSMLRWKATMPTAQWRPWVQLQGVQHARTTATLTHNPKSSSSPCKSTLLANTNMKSRYLRTSTSLRQTPQSLLRRCCEPEWCRAWRRRTVRRSTATALGTPPTRVVRVCV